MLERMSQLVYSVVPDHAISAFKLAEFLVTYLGLSQMAWYTICMYHFVISAFLVPYHHHSVSNYPIISKVMHHVYIQCLPLMQLV